MAGAEYSIDFAHSVASADEFDSALRRAIDDQVASRIGAQDQTLWGPDAEAEARIRLSWTHAAETSRPLITEITALREELRSAGLDHVVLCGMGGSSLAPEVICHADEVELTVLDSSQPDMVRASLADRLERSVVVVASKSGGTVETDSLRRAYQQAFTEAGLDPVQHIIIVTDPGSPLDEEATAGGYRVFRADPHVGGRYSALTAFGLVPSGLAGANLIGLLDTAFAAQARVYSDDASNPALRLGVLLAIAHNHRVDKLVIVDHNGHGVGDWIEQLVAESTGKHGLGILPVVVPDSSSVSFSSSTPDSVVVSVGSHDVPSTASGFGVALRADLGAQMLLWEVATSVAGRLIGINPFDQPDVESAKQAARALLDGGVVTPQPDFSEASIDVFGAGTDLTSAVHLLLDQVAPQHGYLAVQVYLDRLAYAGFADIRELLARRLKRPVTFGWGPRFLHSTGQYHKGGTPNGVFLQITGAAAHDLAVPGRDFTFGSFIDSQAEGDAGVLRDHGRPVLRLHLNDVQAGLDTVRSVIT